MKILLLRGLNTYGDDNLRLGWFNFGDWYSPMNQALSKKGFDVFPIRHMGYESFDLQSQRAQNQIQNLLKNNPGEKDIILIGHSTGGLIARMLAHSEHLTPRVHTIITLATPHQGTPVAETALNWVNTKSLKRTLFKIGNYDLDERQQVLRQYSREFMDQFNQSYPNLYGIDYQHLKFKVTNDGLSLPLWLLDKYRPGLLGESDGLIPTSSQSHGKNLGDFALDHFGAFGYFLQKSKKQKNAAKREFNRLVDKISTHIRSIQM